MPTIRLSPRRIYKRLKHASKRTSEIHRDVYNTSLWSVLRLEYLRNNPLCEMCFSKGIIKSGIDVHHRVPISNATNKMERQALGFDTNNLQTLCKECHIEIHKMK